MSDPDPADVDVDVAVDLRHVREDLADPSPGPDEAAMVGESIARLRDALGQLPPRWADYLACRFGLGDRQPRTGSAIAKEWGITRQRAYQIEERALARLRTRLGGAE